MWIFDIGVSGKVSLLTVARLGQMVQPGESISFGGDDGKIGGLRLAWPDDLDSKIGPRRESIAVLAADHWADVALFETPHLRARGGPGRLTTVLRSLGAGQTRDTVREDGGQLFGALQIHFDLYP